MKRGWSLKAGCAIPGSGCLKCNLADAGEADYIDDSDKLVD